MLSLLRQRNFALLWLAGLIDLAGDWAMIVGLPIYVYQLTGSTLATSGMLAASIIPRLLLGSVAGVFVDRWDRKRTMVLTDALLALSVLPLLLFHSLEQLWIVYAVALAESTLSQFFGPAKSALLPNLVSEAELVPANALNALNGNLARLLGPPFGGLVAAWFGLSGVALVDAASFVLAGALVALIAAPRRPVAPAPSAEAPATRAWVSVWREWLAGLQLVRRDRQVATIFVILGISSLGEGVMGVLFVAFVNRVLGGGAQALGWLLGAQAIGGLLGSTIVGLASRRLAPAYLIGLTAIAFGLIDLAIFNDPILALDIALMVLVGIPGIGFATGIISLLQSSVADEFRGRVFGAQGTTMALLSLVGTALAGTFGDRLGIIAVLNLQGAGYVVAGLLALALLTRRLVPAPTAAPAPEEDGSPVAPESAYNRA